MPVDGVLTGAPYLVNQCVKSRIDVNAYLVGVHLSAQASLTCSIQPDATIKDVSNLGGIEGKEVRDTCAVCAFHFESPA